MRSMRLLAFLLCATPLCAQSFVYSPPVNTSKPGTGWSTGLGNDGDQRIQLFDGTSVEALRDKMVSAVSFRFDEKPAVAFWGRKWTRVAITADTAWYGQPDALLPSTTFTRNLTASATTVFSSGLQPGALSVTV